MIAAARTMILGLLIGGPIALIGFFVFLASLHNLPFWHTQKQLQTWSRSPKCVGGLICLFLGLVIVFLGMVPFLLL